MKRNLLFVSLIIFIFVFSRTAVGQVNQTVTNGDTTKAINLYGINCAYNWINSNTSIGLPASGIGNIPSFHSINNSNSPITATITAIPIDAGFAFIANSIGDNVSVISMTTNKVVANIPVTDPVGVAVNSDGTKLYVTNVESQCVSVINTLTDTLVTQIYTDGPEPFGLCLSPDGTKLYVSDIYGDITIINTATNIVIGDILIDINSLNTSYSLEDIITNLDGSKLYVTTTTGNVLAINTSNPTAINNITVGSSPVGMARSLDGSKIYVANSGSNSISVIDEASDKVIATIATGVTPKGISTSPDGSKLYVTNYGSNNVSVIDVKTNQLTSTILVGLNPFGISFSPDGSRAYVANNGSNDVSVISTATNTVSATINVGSNPTSLGTFITSSSNCNSTSSTFTITVTPTIKPTIVASGVIGSIRACAGSPSASPNIAQFTVAGNKLTAGIIAVAPSGFEVSLNKTNNYGESVILNQSGGVINNTAIYVRSAANALNGTISGNVLLTSFGADSINVVVSGIVNVIPTVNVVPNQTVLNSLSTIAINFNGTANTFTWVNNTPSIGLAASGSGNIAPFTAINKGNTPVVAKITITPGTAGLAYMSNYFLSSYFPKNLSVVNTLTNKVVTTILVGAQPMGVSVSSDGTRVYVANQASNDVSVINTATNAIISSISLGVDTYPSGIIVSPNGKWVYVVNSNSNNISVINTITKTILTNIAVEISPSNIAITPDGSKLYVTNSGSGNVSVINTSTNAIIATITVNDVPKGVTVSPDGTRVYVVNSFPSNNVSVINTATNSVISTIPVGVVPEGIAISPDGKRAYVTNTAQVGASYNVGNVSVINTETNSVISTVITGGFPEGICVSPDGNNVYVAGTGSGGGGFSVISAIADTVIAQGGLGDNPQSFGNFITNGSGCSGQSITFTITVNPPIAKINTDGSLTTFGTTFGSPSVSESFKVSGVNLTQGILVTPPKGFEVSTDDINFSNTISVGAAGMVDVTPVYIRLKSKDQLGYYSGNITLTSAEALDVTLPIDSSLVILPLNNFKLAITSATCKGNNDGMVSITATQNLNYTATITGNGVNNAIPFTTTGVINNLSAGTYNVCITVAGQPDYQQCYSVVITEPKDLSLYATVNEVDKSINLSLNGGARYNINLNGTLYSTTDSTITLPLQEGNNNLLVSTDKVCQGSIQKEINISGKIIPYPVPFQNTLNINLGNRNVSNVLVEVHNTIDGKLLYSKQYVNQSNVLQLDLSALQTGVYALYLTMDNTVRIFKILK